MSVGLQSPADSAYRLTRTGLVVARDLSLEDWRRIGHKIAAFSSAVAWAIGDWLIYGEGLGEDGELYAEAASITGRSYESLGQYARVSREFAVDQRDQRVPWAHYRLILSLPPQKRTAALAGTIQHRWTQTELRTWMREGAPAAAVGEKASGRHVRRVSGWRPPEEQKRGRRVACPQCGHQFNAPRAR